jgi:deoxyribodipyrimidine photo-lyase
VKPQAAIVWLRLDLRLSDNAALHAALALGGPVLPVFIWGPEEEGDWPPGAASRWWLHQSLTALDRRLRQHGSRLLLRRGPALETLRAVVRETGAGAVFWNRRYEPAIVARDAQIKNELRREGLIVESFNAALLHEPWTIQNQSGKPFRVFTPFWRHCLNQTLPGPPLAAPKALPAPARWPMSLALAELDLEPKTNWADGFRQMWQPGEAGALAHLDRFLSQAVDDYAEQRDRPDRFGTSRLSPHLHFGEISPRQIWHAVRRRAEAANVPDATWRAGRFLMEIGWREFSHHLLYHFPHTPIEPLRAEFRRFPWRKSDAGRKAWQRGRTGFPIVDAGMRELWTTGWMHNRVRMIVASFLVKDLGVSWLDGARWFWDTLVDADLAQNTLGWQWTAGCGADAAPYFRIFNPTTQGERFDPEGDYVRRWCPELARLPAKWIHQPDKAPPEILKAAGVQLDRTYPAPVISHAIAREVALESFARLKSSKHQVRAPHFGKT